MLGFAAKDSRPMYVGLAVMPTVFFGGWTVSISIKNGVSGGDTMLLEKLWYEVDRLRRDSVNGFD